MTEFEKAMTEYEEHFDRCYPYAIGYGYPGKTDEENIAIIRKSIADDRPVEMHPQYIPDHIY